MKNKYSIKFLYDFFGGRKVFFFIILLSLNTYILLCTEKWSDGFGWFTAGLYSLIVLGVESNKFIKGTTEYKEEENE